MSTSALFRAHPLRTAEESAKLSAAGWFSFPELDTRDNDLIFRARLAGFALSYAAVPNSQAQALNTLQAACVFMDTLEAEQNRNKGRKAAQEVQAAPAAPAAKPAAKPAGKHWAVFTSDFPADDIDYVPGPPANPTAKDAERTWRAVRGLYFLGGVTVRPTTPEEDALLPDLIDPEDTTGKRAKRTK